MSEETTRRASGLSAGADQAKPEDENFHDKPIDDVPHLPIEDESSRRKYRSPGFHRMRVNWDDEEGRVIKSFFAQMETRLHMDFPAAYTILDEIHELVREPITDSDGKQIIVDGKRQWAMRNGQHVEDYSKLTWKQKDDYAFRITTWMATWEQKAQEAWLESMFSRVAWEERYAIKYDEPARKTMGERDAIAKKEAIDERYFAVFLAAYSRQCEALVRVMRNLVQKIEKSLTS